ncbi:hypothetical protein Ga0074812_11795 [Parafrankia irregularis]|uniref:Uncharacterized protein n=2 Tax=Parafrankia irregularis TaxID=795642 RepID=A0A0S4QUQ0_9ACTN|nr:hypothetical protein [Parafrankia sp. CH37]CUU58186.1 hypothetical protein Ga0074812_11795 [Parafrankia irregularis]
MTRKRMAALTRPAVVVAAVVSLTVGLGGCNGSDQDETVSAPVSTGVAGSPAPATSTSPAQPATASPTPVVTASPVHRTPSPSPVDAITAAVKSEPTVARDVVVQNIRISSIDSTWAYAGAYSPSAGGAQAVLHRTGDAWRLVSYGSAEVGCGEGVPAAVMTEFGLDCPS